MNEVPSVKIVKQWKNTGPYIICRKCRARRGELTEILEEDDSGVETRVYKVQECSLCGGSGVTPNPRFVPDDSPEQN